ncbi:MAG: 3-deoxy-manno-octulosonate cytidylyltransferase [Candidatus Omnitrophota bacterium]
MNVIGVIPARYESTRCAHKLVREVFGKPLIQWTWENAKCAHLLDKLIIATDSPVIAGLAKEFNTEAVLTSVEHPSGTDRIAEAVRDIEAKIVINIQADEPLVHPSVINSVAQVLLDNPQLVMATAIKKIDDPRQMRDPNVVKVIADRDGYAMYFSRFPIPYYRNSQANKLHYKHIGVYGYTKDFLFTFKNLLPSPLEKAEKLEQLRAIEAGYKIKLTETQFESWGVDSDDDFDKIEQLLKERKYV